MLLLVASGASVSLAAEGKEHGLPQHAVELGRPFGFPITNSMFLSSIVTVGLIVFARVATRDMKHVPGLAQNFAESLVSGVYQFLEDIIGSHLAKRTFWFMATIFILILSANWFGLIPGVGQSAGVIRARMGLWWTSRCCAGFLAIAVWKLWISLNLLTI